MKKLIAVKLRKDEDIINAKLTPTGIEQVEAAGKKLLEDFPEIKRVVSSPMRRVIMTFERALKGFENFDNGTMPITFIPELRETLQSSCDVGCYTKNEFEGIKYIDRYDRSFMEKAKDPHFWFLDSCTPAVKKRAREAMEGATTVQEKREKLVKNFVSKKEYLPFDWEGPECNYKRVNVLALNKIKKIIQEENLKDNELIAFGHCISFAYLTGKNWDLEKFETKDHRIMKNAEVFQIEIEVPLSKKKNFF